jgi:hypothetical protein
MPEERFFEELSLLTKVGATLHGQRASVLSQESIGLTQLYKRLHDSNDTASRIVQLRELSCDIDLAVVEAYDWDDLNLGHGFHEVPYLPENDRVRFTISEPARVEVLRRLSELNRLRYNEEVEKGLHGK